ncbi:class E sortase [Streptomyces sp. NPDC051569]|uniref:class E sortase n=1 Tax=Streptomyces sp. NPDC051569 TaxID=3365661 RepID=UPI0037B9351E
MTVPLPGRDGGRGAPYEPPGAYGDTGEFEAAVDGLVDPLNDPLPGQRRETRQTPDGGRRQDRRRDERQDPPPSDPPAGRRGQDSPWVRVGEVQAEPVAETVAEPGAVPSPVAAPEWSGDYYRQYAEETPLGPPAPYYAQEEPDAERTLISPAVVLPESGGPGDGTAGAGLSGAGVPLPGREEPEPRTGGRAERRKAAKGGGRGRKRTEPPVAGPPGPGPGSGSASDSAGVAPARPLSRVEARRAARALKDSPAVIASRAVGELFITFGVLMLLFVTYQLWWTNVAAGQYAGQETDKIQDGWAKGRQPDAFEPGQGFAIMHIPKLDVVVPIAEGISKAKVLDHGMVGHYSEGSLKTAMPSDKLGNFAVAGHRNTHGEPFRYVNQLQPGDQVIVETQDAYYTYDMTKTLPQTSPSNVSVIDPVPAGSGFTKPGRYITLTTCTPEFTSTYRMIVWGKMVDERPRGKGKPDALVG